MSRKGVGLTRVALLVVVTGAGVGTLWPVPPGPARAAAPPAPAAVGSIAAAAIKPVPLPDPKIKGFHFPEDEGTIIGWTKTNNQKAINLHGWGSGPLNLPTGEMFNGQDLRVFETWLTPQDILTAQVAGAKDLTAPVRSPRALTHLRQFSRGPKGPAPSPHGDDTITGFVKYDPSAAEHILDKNLFKASALNALLAAGKTAVPAFPFTAVSLKVRYQIAQQSQLVGGRYFMLAVWPGPPDPPAPFGPTAWKQCVWVDVNDPGAGPGTGQVDTECKPDGSSRKPESTYGLGRVDVLTS